ncbi:MAG: type II CAAX endopeptidase family protein [bacterium]
MLEEKKDNNDDKINIEDDDNSKIVPKIPPLFTGLASVILIFILYQLAGSAIFLLIFGADVLNISKFSAYDINMFRLLTIGGQILFMLFPTLVITKYVYKDVTAILRVKRPKIFEIMLFFAGFVLLTPLLQYIMAFQTYIVEYLAKSNTTLYNIKQFLDSMNSSLDDVYNKVMIANNPLEYFGIILFAAVTPAICEEFLFRGLVQKSFEMRFKVGTAIFITAFIFSVYHFNPYGLLPLILLAMYFGYSVYLSKSIIISMLLHFINNFFSITVMNVFRDKLGKETEVFTQGNIYSDLFTFVIILIIFILLMRYIFNYYKKQTIITEAI